MRLSPKHRVRSQGALAGDVGVCFTSRGVVEVVRLGHGEPIVIVPGLAGGWKLVEPLARHLARTHEVILYGLAGDPGAAQRVRHDTIADYALDLAELITTLRLERPTVLGVSFGGAVALQLAVERPSVVGELVVSGIASSFSGGLGPTIALHVLEKYPLPPSNPFINQFFNLLHGGKPRSEADAEFVVERIWETDQGVMASRLRALDGFDVSDRLWRVDCPSLIAAGARDVIVTPAQQRELAQAIPGARFETLSDSGHLGFLTHSATFGRHVRRLLRERQQAAY